MNNDEEQANGAQVIDDLDLSEADSSVVDEDQGRGDEKKTNSTEDRENSVNTEETRKIDKIDIKNLKSREERRQSTFESMDLSDDEEEDEDKKATLQAIQRIASVGGFNDLVKLEDSIRQTRRKHLAKRNIQNSNKTMSNDIRRFATLNRMASVTNNIDLSASLGSTSTPNRAKSLKRLTSSSNLSLHSSTSSIPDSPVSTENDIDEVARKLSGANIFDMDGRGTRNITRNNSFVKRSGSLLARSNSLHNLAQQVNSLRETNVAVKAKEFVFNFSITYNSLWVTLLICLLYLDDLRVAFMPAEADMPVFVISFIVFTLLWIEVITASLLVELYFNSSFFWLDILTATASFPFEILFQKNIVTYDTNAGLEYIFISRSAQIYQIVRSIKAASLSFKVSNNVSQILDHTLYDRQSENINANSQEVLQRTPPNSSPKYNATLPNTTSEDFGASPLKSSLTRVKFGVSPTVRARRRSSLKDSNDFLFSRDNETILNDKSKDSIIGEKLVKLTKVKTLVGTTIILLVVNLFATLPYYNYMESFGLKMLHKSYGKFIDKTETFKVDYVDPYITAIERSTAKNTMFAPKRMVLHLKVGNFTAIHDFDANQVRP